MRARDVRHLLYFILLLLILLMCAIYKDVNVTRRADFIYLIMENGKWAPMKMPNPGVQTVLFFVAFLTV